MAQTSARCVIAHSFGSAFLVIGYDERRKDEARALRGWTLANRTDTGQSRQKEGLASMPPPMETRGHLRRARETDAPGSSSKRPEKPQRRRSTTHLAASSRFRAVQQCRQQPSRSTATQTDNVDVCERAPAT